ncbi:MAG TPA: septal ring lytic transglycosylase RlpA family protein [Solirubrobacterales bacterium]
MHNFTNPIRWALALIALAVACLGGISAAQAATGGASSYEAVAPPAPESEGGVAFSTPLRYGSASWYGPGLYGRNTACGVTLGPTTLGVAHKSLPCGTTVKFVYRGRTLITQVIDRGPYTKGRTWDLTIAASKALGFESAGIARLAYAVEIAPTAP